MSWDALRDLGASIRPLDAPLPPLEDRASPFDSPLGSTLRVLQRELQAVDAGRIAIGLAFSENQLRSDGMPRSAARLDDPRVILAFESRHGPLRYATGAYRRWQDNLRAIALSLEALRKVDRYGVSKRGEQYRGWRAIPVSTDAADSIATREQAEEYVGRYGGLVAAIKATHPDTHGPSSSDAFRKVMRAKELLRS